MKVIYISTVFEDYFSSENVSIIDDTNDVKAASTSSQIVEQTEVIKVVLPAVSKLNA